MKTKFPAVVQGLALAIAFLLSLGSLSTQGQTPNSLPIGTSAARLENAKTNSHAIVAYLMVTDISDPNIRYIPSNLYLLTTNFTKDNFVSVASNMVFTCLSGALSQENKDGEFRINLFCPNLDESTLNLSMNDPFHLVKTGTNYSLPDIRRHFEFTYSDVLEENRFSFPAVISYPGIQHAIMNVWGDPSDTILRDSRDPNVATYNMSARDDTLTFVPYYAVAAESGLYGYVDVFSTSGTKRFDLRTGLQVAPLTIWPLCPTNGCNRFNVSGGVIGQLLTLEHSTNFTGGWTTTTVFTNSVGTLGHEPGNNGAHFYRLKTVQ